MIVSHSRKFIFLKSRKTAGTSLETALSNVCSDADVVTPLGDYEFNKDPSGRWQHQAMNATGFEQHDEAVTIREKVGPAAWETYFKFSVTRNPWDRVVSLFTWRTRRQRKESTDAIDDRGDKDLPAIRAAFREYLASDWETNDAFYFLNGRLCVDKVLRYESLRDDIDELCTRFGIERIELPRLKTGFRSRLHYSQYYDSTAREIVATRHANDVREFGYRFESN